MVKVEPTIVYESENVVLNTSNVPIVEEEILDQCDQQDVFNILELESEFRKLSVRFNLKWLNRDNVFQKLVYEMQEDVKKMLLMPIKQTVSLMSSAGLITDPGSKAIDSILSMFDNMETEYKFVQKLKSIGLFEDPICFTISSELKPGVIDDKQDMVINSSQACLLPIKFQLKKYLESKGMMMNLEN